MKNKQYKHGFHYLPDTRSYRQADLATWLPHLQALQAGWLVLSAPRDRAIPEFFLRGLLEAGIEPLLHFQDPGTGSPNQILAELAPFCEIYARWGIRYISFFNRPNLRRTWQARQWVQADLVEGFLDQYLPLANASLQYGLIPVFPPLEPGGDYWDTAFLRAALQGIQRRGQQALLASMVLGAVSNSQGRALHWGSGGPERWPEARPYQTSDNTEDQRGFRIFDWYLAISRGVLSHPLPIFLFEMGATPTQTASAQEHAEIHTQIARLLDGEHIAKHEPLPEAVIGGAFWPFTTSRPHQPGKTWFELDSKNLPVVAALENWLHNTRPTPRSLPTRPAIAHYLLLPRYEWGIADYHLEVIRPFIKKYQPTIGFSIEEAAHSQRVTVIGDRTLFSDEVINQLRANGCIVERIEETGMDLAPKIAAL